MLPSALERILALPADALVLDVGGWGAPLRRADWVLDLQPWSTRGIMGSFGPAPERFSEATWVQRDMCDREPWPFADDEFDFAVCVTTLEDVRDPIWVCSELSRVAKAGYVEVPTVEAELIYNVEGQGAFLGHEHHRWFVDREGDGLVFWHKSHMVHVDPTIRVLPRWRVRMTLEDHLLGVFWEGSIPARERIGTVLPDLDALRERVHGKFRPSPAELRLKAARERARHLAASAALPLRRAAEAGWERARR